MAKGKVLKLAEHRNQFRIHISIQKYTTYFYGVAILIVMTM